MSTGSREQRPPGAIITLGVAGMPVRLLTRFLRTQPSAFPLNKERLHLILPTDDDTQTPLEDSINLSGWNFAALERSLSELNGLWRVHRQQKRLVWRQVPIPWSEPSARKTFFNLLREDFISRTPPWDVGRY